MRKKLRFCFAAAFAALLLLLSYAGAALAAPLSEMVDEFAKYQADPLSRAEQLRAEIRRIQDREEGTARQYGVKVSDVLEYEFALEDLVDAYNSLYFIQNEGEIKNTFLLDDSRISTLMEQSPPYPFIFYLDVSTDEANCRRELRRLAVELETARAKMSELRERRGEIEKNFRLSAARDASSAEERLKRSFELDVQRTRLEICLTQFTYYEHSHGIARDRIREVEGKLDHLAPLVRRVRENISTENDGFDVLNSIAYRQTEKLRATLASLNERFHAMDGERLRRTYMTPLERYCNATGRSLAEDEAIYVLDMIKLWAATRMAWRSTYDLLLGHTTAAENREMQEQMRSLISYAERHIEMANENLQLIRSAEQEVQRRFAAQDGADETIAGFMRELSEHKGRYLSYIVTLGAMCDQFETLTGEAERSMGERGADEKIIELWTQNLGGLLDMELWNIDDYPITLKKFMLAAALFVAGFYTTRFAASRARRHFESAGTLSRHTLLLVQNSVFYAGLALSFLLTLWTLRIPLTAFAFMGGAAAIAIGLGTQRLMGDMLAGIQLLFQKKIRIGDEVIVDGTYGVVSEITLQNTVLLCKQTRHLIIPNSRMLVSSVLNLTLNNSISRSDIDVSIAYESDVARAMALLRSLVAANEHVLKNPPVRIIISELEDSALKLTAYFFIDLGAVVESNVKSELYLAVLEAFEKNNIEIPYPQSEVRLKRDDGAR